MKKALDEQGWLAMTVRVDAAKVNAVKAKFRRPAYREVAMGLQPR